MPKTIVVGDSVAVGIGQAIPGAQVFAQGNLRIDQMRSYFDRAIASAAQGDVVIISAGYNSTGSNGLSQADIGILQSSIDQLVAKGANVVIPPLREAGMAGDYAHLNGLTARSNAQLRGLRNVTVANACSAVSNGLAGGEIHGGYSDLARICQAAATASRVATRAPNRGTPRPAPAAGAPAAADGEAETETQSPPAGAEASAGGGFGDIFKSIIDAILGFFRSLFGGASTEAPASAAPAAPNASAQPAGQPASTPALAQEQARGAVPQQTTVSGGQDVASTGTPTPRAPMAASRTVG